MTQRDRAKLHKSMTRIDRSFRVDNHFYESIQDYKCVKNTRVGEVDPFSKFELILRIAESARLNLIF